MVAYMNEEALRRTIAEGQAWYYSRSRQQLWHKGETSGHIQKVVDLRLDCDRDTILLLVEQTGVACHEDYFSCFHYRPDLADPDNGDSVATIGRPGVRPQPQQELGNVLAELAVVIHSRRLERPEGAYTAYLFDKGIDKILKKVGEESAEVIIAAKNNAPEEIRYEVADLFYHVLVMLEDRGVSLTEIAAELAGRRK